MVSLTRRRVVALGAIAVLLAGTLGVGRLAMQGGASVSNDGTQLPRAAKDFLETSQAGQDENGGESAELATATDEFAEARLAPGIVAPGAYGAALSSMEGLGTTGGAWSEVTNVKYDADNPDFRDYWSNSSGGSGLVTGRITGLAADGAGNVYAAGADGGVWRSTTGGGDWAPIADGLASLSSGDLQLAADGSLWYATGEANTGGTSYVGAGVYRLADPATGTFTRGDRVGGDELESTTINAIRFGGGLAWVATLRGIYYHSASTTSGPWTLSFAPNPSYLPGGANAADPNAAYKNIVNDIAIDPHNPKHLIAGVGWRSGDTYNGFYETWDGGAGGEAGDHWVKINPTGAINPKDIGNVSFAWAADGSKLYVMNQSPVLLNKMTGTVNSYLDGIYVSNSGSITGPWTKIATSTKLANSGSALKQSVGGKGYGPGIQSWYNQFLIVDPTNPNHLYAGLEEVYETKDGGANWNTAGPYWNFYFSCYRVDSVYPPNGTPNGCPQTTHADQHSAAVGTYEGHTYLYVGNDGGVYRRPLNGTVDANGNATDWQSLNDGTIDALQYYSVAVGPAHAATTPEGWTGSLVSGGLQDNGGSLLSVGQGTMVSNFGGDGGDTFVDPANGCNIVGEYTGLTMYVTNDCAYSHRNWDQFFDYSKSTTWTIAPPDINARFIAPFTGDVQDPTKWLAGGNSLWFNDKGFAIRSGSEWQKVHTFSSPVQVATAVAYNGEWAIATWCGPCNNAGFTRGLAVGQFTGDTWTWTDYTPAELDLAGVIPNRYLAGAYVANDGTLYIVANGFSRRFTEGPGAGVGHVFKSTDHGATWESLDNPGGAAFPDVPANSIKVLPDGSLVVGTDLGVMYLGKDSTSWLRVGPQTDTAGALPLTTVMDVEVAPDGYLYAATHGRGIWRIALSALGG